VVGYLIVVAILSCTTLIAFLAYLSFCEKVMDKRGNPEDLKHAAAAARGFRAAGLTSLAEMITKWLPSCNTRPTAKRAQEPANEDSTSS
jgi:hypothetical protein